MKTQSLNNALSFLKIKLINRRDILVPAILTTLVVDLIAKLGLSLLNISLSTVATIAVDIVTMALAALIALTAFVMPKLHRLEQRYTRDVSNLLDAIDHHCIFATADSKGTITYANQKFTDISGYALDELIGKNHNILNSGYFTKEDWKEFYTTLSEGRVWQGNIRNVTKNSEYYWVFTTVNPVFKGNKLIGYYSLRSDITDIVLQAEKALDMVSEVQQAEQRITNFTNHIVHELRTPIHIISNFNSILFTTMQQSKNIEMLKQSQEVVNHMSELVNELLDLAKIKQGILELSINSIDLHRLLKLLTEELRASVSSKEVAVELTIDDSLPRYIHGDEKRLKQTIYNLTSNAKKFTRRGSITISASYQPSNANEDDIISIAVKDTGEGISETNLNFLFNEFFQVQGSQAANGTGLGLTISKKIMNLMGGDITVNSELGVGSTFTITLPTSIPSEQPVTPEAIVEGQVFNEETLKGYTLVVVDDVPTNVMITEAILEKYGANVQSYFNPEDALSYVSEHLKEIDAVITDMHMPQMDGIELTRKIRALENSDALIIFGLSGAFDEADLEAEAEQAGMTASLSKPIDIRQIVGLLLAHSKE